MPNKLPIGPYRIIETDLGVQFPWYIMPFDDHGRCTAPLTYDHLLSSVQVGSYTDIFLFSHGWNNDWKVASERYDRFLNGYIRMRQDHKLMYPRLFQPLLVGIFWPSVALVLPWEKGPEFAALPTDDPQYIYAEVGQERQEIQSLAATLAKDDLKRFYALAQREADLSENELTELARILAPFYSMIDNELPIKDPPPSLDELIELWQAIARSESSVDTSGEFGFADEPTRAPGAAGILNYLDPRLIIRLTTVLQMKDRAGRVGAYGVGTLLRDLLLKNKTVRLHLIGHSYGCKIVLSALCFQDLPRPINSLLLLQPAVSYLCFARDASGTGQPGGYRVALERVEQPILTTFSSQDAPLTQFFHLTVKRRTDLGEMQIAGVPPNQYAALGGYGPGGCETECRIEPMRPIDDHYDWGSDAPKIYALNGSQAIHNHGDISNNYTWWALYEQVTH